MTGSVAWGCVLRLGAGLRQLPPLAYEHALTGAAARLLPHALPLPPIPSRAQEEQLRKMQAKYNVDGEQHQKAGGAGGGGAP